ncbi:CatB-related O-acetyltransferase [Rhodospirillaceae bacterium SYSU D60014]|uniref:CatB-related O-acetyltransferase n=1 Tax=Virgifigura deserti TaxID=2268457 RepID=UPI000E66879D
MSPAILGPDPNLLHPVPEHPRIMFVKNLTDLPNIQIGDFTYYDDPEGPEAFRRNILYHYEFTGDRLKIGKFCAMATGTKFIMNGGNHRMDGITTFPFPIFGPDWRNRFEGEFNFRRRGDTTVGNDVWIGYDSLVLPGVTVGDGAIIGARSVVAGDVPPYAIVAGNPARVVRMRFDEKRIARLLELRWWDWDVGEITRHISILSAGRVEDLPTLR